MCSIPRHTGLFKILITLLHTTHSICLSAIIGRCCLFWSSHTSTGDCSVSLSIYLQYISILRACFQKIRQNSLPPFLGPSPNIIVWHYLVTQVNSTHEFLVVRKTWRATNFLLATIPASPCHWCICHSTMLCSEEMYKVSLKGPVHSY